MRIKELREILATISTEFDDCKVITPTSDHGYEDVSHAMFDTYVMERVRNQRSVMSEWYGDPKDYNCSTMKTFKAAGHTIEKALVIS